jgi:gluconate kinase
MQPPGSGVTSPEAGRVLVIAGPPGAGKSTVARLVSERLRAPAVCIETDWFWTTITHGFIQPWESDADGQNQIVLRAAAAAAAEFSTGGYLVVLEGVVGPWMLPVVRDRLREANVGVDYVVVRPDLDTCLRRATGRLTDQPRGSDHLPLTASGPIRDLWTQFSDLGAYEHYVLDTTRLDPEATTAQIVAELASGTLALRADGN